MLDQLIEIGGVLCLCRHVPACAELGGLQGLLIRTAVWGPSVKLYAELKRSLTLHVAHAPLAILLQAKDGCRPVMLECGCGFADLSVGRLQNRG
jgi:hypothetical protein